MKRIKNIILTAGLVSLLAVAAAGCGSSQTTAPKEDAAKAPAAAATYVGDESCKGCHDKASTAFAATKHSGAALKPITAFQLAEGLPKSVALFDGADPKNTKPTQIDLSTAKLYGVMVNEYLLSSAVN
ncbi:MAG TPA: hypothetical protein VHS59_09365 [Bacillota bacterium]|nr:hypothetical protein [Bacillota bacterium]